MKTSEWLMSFANLGFIKDGGQTAINPQRVAPGVILLAGVSNNSLVVRRASGVVVVEGALHDLRAEAVIDFVRRRFPGARITHVITTHHHSDHSGGMRPYVALGARAVLHEAAVPFFRQGVPRAQLERSCRTGSTGPTVLPGSCAVPDGGSVLLNDADQRIEVLLVRRDALGRHDRDVRGAGRRAVRERHLQPARGPRVRAARRSTT